MATQSAWSPYRITPTRASAAHFGPEDGTIANSSHYKLESESFS